MPLLSEIERRAWDTRGKADAHPPANALKAALDDIESGKIKPEHVVVVYVEQEDTGYYQGGSNSNLEVLGTLRRAADVYSRVEWQG